MKIQNYISEAIGTFFLTFVVYVSIAGGFSAVATPVLAALTLGICVYTIGSFSGTHINPAVTIGLWSIKKINTQNAVFYIISQVIGAAVAMLLASQIFDLATGVAASMDMRVLFAEILGAFIFTFGIASAVYGKAERSFAGVVVGGSLLLGISIAAGLGSNGVLNPAVAFGIGSFNLMYALGPILGSVLGFNVYKMLSNEK